MSSSMSWMALSGVRRFNSDYARMRVWGSISFLVANLAGGIALQHFGAGILPAQPPGAASVQAPPQGITADYGKYVATYGECRGCHGPDLEGTAESALGPAVPSPRPLVGTLDQAQFVAMMRGGVKPDGAPFPETMPWRNAAKMTDDDLAALYAYLIAPVQ